MDGRHGQDESENSIGERLKSLRNRRSHTRCFRRWWKKTVLCVERWVDRYRERTGICIVIWEDREGRACLLVKTLLDVVWPWLSDGESDICSAPGLSTADIILSEHWDIGSTIWSTCIGEYLGWTVVLTDSPERPEFVGSDHFLSQVKNNPRHVQRTTTDALDKNR